MLISCSIGLPRGFCAGHVLAFHRRDPQQLSERVEADTLRKGLAWAGRPACLTIRFGARRAQATLAVDGNAGNDDPAALRRMVRRMLGLDQRIEAFERAWQAHPQVGTLIARNPGLRVPLTATPFEAIVWAVTGQQISLVAALSLRRRMIRAAGLAHSGGLACHPDAPRLAAMTDAELRQAGFSQSRADTLIALARQVEQGLLPLHAWADAPPVEEIRTQLLRIRGIGPWTVDFTLLRGFGWLDGSLHGDAAVRRNLQRLLGSPQKVTAEEAKQWLAGFSPWRALVAAHLWAMGAAAIY